MKTIIVAVDFSSITSHLIEKAGNIAQCNKSRVYIIHVASPNPDFIGNKVGPIHERQIRAIELKQEKKELERLADKLNALDIEATPLLIQGATAELILIEIQRLDADLLIMGTHGHGPALSTLLGSTSHQIMKHVSCPVLLIPYKIKNA